MEETGPRKRSSRWLLIAALVLAAGLLYLTLRKVTWGDLVNALRQGNVALLAVSVGILSVSCFVRALRWRVLLSVEAPTASPLTVFWALMTGYLGNSYLPARAGEVVRSVLVGQELGISKSFSLATALTERIMDAVILVGVGALALSSLASLPPEFTTALKALGVVAAVGAVAVLVAPRVSGLVQAVITRLPGPVRLREKLWGIVEQFLLGAGALQSGSRLVQFLLYSIVIWSLDSFNGLVVARAFGLDLNVVQVFVLLSALGLASALPSTPGYIGVYQFVAVNVLAPFGVSEAPALAYILAFQGVQYIGITLWGVIGLWQLRGAIRQMGGFRKAQEI